MELRFRQVHLDFHTSEHIEGIGADFEPDEFAETLARAHVNSITCFARCHHGYIYYDTKLFPERRHPRLTRDLLKEQIEACHKRDIRVPIYITVQWDHFTANEHPEWLILDADGKVNGTPPYEAGFYRRFCLNSRYVDFLKSHVREVLETLPTDGIFFDIVAPQDCSCARCRQGMVAAGMNPSEVAARKAFGLQVHDHFCVDMTAFVRQFNADCTVFYNAGHVAPRHRPIAEAYSHFEIESLPSGGWGYMHFPVTMRFARGLGRACMGMTGKFHTSWGDFHSFKNRAALEFECFQMLALNGTCSVGDQLHPRGKICPVTYDLIGSVYESVERKEPWCTGATPVTEIGVLTPEEFQDVDAGLPPAIFGATRMLQEARLQFDILDSQADFSKYRVLILPDEIPVEALRAKLDSYVAQGGSIIASYRSAFGVEVEGEAPYSPDFLRPGNALMQGLPPADYVMYLRGMKVQPLPGSEVLADVVAPYFNRTFEHFCSHRHTPFSGAVAYPGAIRNQRCIYFAHPIFTQYHRNAPRWCKQLVVNAIKQFLPDPLITLEGPSTILTALNEQKAQKRWVLHLLHYVPERRGTDFDIIEDVIPLHNIPVSIKTPHEVKAVATAPEGVNLKFVQKDGRVEFVVPKIAGHQTVELRF